VRERYIGVSVGVENPKIEWHDDSLRMIDMGCLDRNI
jgi:hypothetical protein